MTGLRTTVANAVTIISYIVTLTITTAIVTHQAIAQQPLHYSHKELHRWTASAGDPDADRKLATYFHCQEWIYRAKAQAEMEEYARCVRNILMAPKFPTRADVTSELHDYYSYKADQEAKLATRYDEMLIRRGIKPTGQSAATVSLTSLAKSSALSLCVPYK